MTIKDFYEADLSGKTYRLFVPSWWDQNNLFRNIHDCIYMTKVARLSCGKDKVYILLTKYTISLYY